MHFFSFTISLKDLRLHIREMKYLSKFGVISVWQNYHKMHTEDHCSPISYVDCGKGQIHC